jgi:long-chain acyl-CoA synthetase
MNFEPRFATLVDILAHSTATYGDRELFGTKKDGVWLWITYAEFGSLVERFRGGLASLGVQRGDCVACISNNRVEWAVAAYACYSLGVAFVPMYEAQNPREWEFIVGDCEAKLLIAANDAVLARCKPLLDAIPSLASIVLFDGTTNGDGRVTTYDALVSSGKKADAIRALPGDPAALIYTSGTTGNAKGVILTHFNIASNVSAVHDLIPIGEDDRSLSFLPWAHVFGQTGELHLFFSIGASMALCEAVDKLLDNLREVRPTVLLSVPTIFNRIYVAVQTQIAGKPRPIRALVKAALKITAKERSGERLTIRELALLGLVDKLVFAKVRARFGGRLKYAVSGGAALSLEVAEFIDSLGITIFEGYGLTETSPVTSVNLPGARKIGSVGRAIPGVHIDIDPGAGERKPAESGKPARFEGEIIVHGQNVMKGYFKRPEENAAVFTPDGGFRTGDLGFFDPQGFLFITGRIKEQYKLENGKYVVPTPLEDALKLSPYVANVMVYGDNKPFNVALIVASLPALQKWGQSQHMVLPVGAEAILRDDRVRALFTQEVEKHGSRFKGYEAIKDFALIADDFTTDNGMVTPSLKLKRRKVIEAFGPLLEGLYAGRTSKGEPGTQRPSPDRDRPPALG